MLRIPVLGREEMTAEQRKVYDEAAVTTGRVDRGPSIGYAYSPGLWQAHRASSAHLRDCSLTPMQVRIVSLVTVRHWNASYPWSAQAVTALAAGIDIAVVEAINAGAQPEFTDPADLLVHDVARELLATGTLSDEIFEAAKSTIGYPCLADVVGVIGHFSATAMMGNVAGAEAAPGAPSMLKA
ncbi:MAG: hypothetical protein O7C66_03605 [Alphaproteobacteria bacterium]|nr:hypothetical protein [Alphaproteobacteria bacterium]